MKTLMTCLLLSVSYWLVGQSNMNYFIGIHPSVTVEKFYEKGAFDVNIIPLVGQTSLTKRTDVRGTCYYTYHFGDENTLADTGLELAFPTFLKKKELKHDKSGGFYFSPTIGFGRNFLNDHNTLTVAAEPGYMVKTKGKFGLTVYLQYGGSLFMYAEDVDVWQEHFGIKVNIGLWNIFNKQ